MCASAEVSARLSVCRQVLIGWRKRMMRPGPHEIARNDEHQATADISDDNNNTNDRYSKPHRNPKRPHTQRERERVCVTHTLKHIQARSFGKTQTTAATKKNQGIQTTMARSSSLTTACATSWVALAAVLLQTQSASAFVVNPNGNHPMNAAGAVTSSRLEMAANPSTSEFLSPSQAKACIDAANGTPLYAYSMQKLEDSANDCLAFPNAYGLTVRYAMKACPNQAILQFFNSKGIHIDASSGFEVCLFICLSVYE